VLYTWNGTGNTQQWFKNFGTNTATLSNAIAGELTVAETGAAGSPMAISDDFNRVRETPAGPNGGLDLTGLSAMEFDIGHNGASTVSVQFFVQASTASNFVALGPNLNITPGVNTYSVPLSPLTADQQVYIRTIGFNITDHSGLGNLNWTVREVRSTGTPLSQRVLENFDNGSVEGGLQGSVVNFDGASVAGNTGQNQTGLSHNSSGSGSLQWTDVAGGAGGAISWGNGTALNGNTFNNRVADLSNYATVTIRMSATAASGPEGSVNAQAFFQANNFASFQTAGTLPLPIDGQFHDLVFSLAGLTNMNVVDQTGLNLGSHAAELVINVDSVTFNAVPEPGSAIVLALAAAGWMGARRHSRRAR